MRPALTVCGLGPGGEDHLTEGARRLLAGDRPRILRTSRHPTAHLAGPAPSFDELYERHDTFDEVYTAIVAELASRAEAEPLLYVVPGSPLVLEETVRRLRDDDRLDVEVVPGLSFLDLVWARLGIDPVEAGVRLVDGHRFAVEAAGERGPLLVAHVHAAWVLSDIKLASEGLDDEGVVVLQGLGTDRETVTEVAWSDLDRAVRPDHLTTLYIPRLAQPVAGELAATVALMHRLRQECPWDQAQDHASLRPYLLEESHEVLEALDGLVTVVGDETEVAVDGGSGADDDSGADLVDGATLEAYALLEEELGDLWFQILFHAELAAEAGQFTVADVARTLHDKLVRRHPHVFAAVEVAGTAEVVANWDAIKRVEKEERSSALDGIPGGLPALALAAKVLQRARRAGAPVEPNAFGDIDPASMPLDDEVALGRFLLALVARTQDQGLDPETALRSAVVRASDRFRAEEAAGPVGPQWVRG